ncbi:hypothetical protein BpHYR1_049457 [Brachionus plicatilis]|uniref:Uncharacterized protein n=1 Tax=Brachionus plicatilis TaxID=10195 RepID=A0A3M7R3A4_BRAPC|nr:hypothetical protein BpHYR1_049457 [Brachionus plicatilis]
MDTSNFKKRFLNFFIIYDVTTKIRIERDTFAEYPAITFCNSNPYTTLDAIIFFKSLISNILGSLNPLKTREVMDTCLNFLRLHVRSDLIPVSNHLIFCFILVYD